MGWASQGEEFGGLLRLEEYMACWVYAWSFWRVGKRNLQIKWLVLCCFLFQVLALVCNLVFIHRRAGSCPACLVRLSREDDIEDRRKVFLQQRHAWC